MGVSGCGKTTIGNLLAEEIGFSFYDADNFHSQSNIDKMKNNIPLTDKDRIPWLQLLAEKIKIWNINNGVILACSALKESYRQILTTNSAPIFWIYLDGRVNVIQSRVESRDSHFMKSSLLRSQFEALEIPEYGLHIPVTNSPQQIVAIIKSKLILNE